MSRADDVPALLRALNDADATRPRVTWYGPSGPSGPQDQHSERIELSARVLDNWVAKTANLLVEELDAGPGTTVAVDLPAHWRTLVWLLATWSVGAEAVVPADQGAPPAGARTDAGARPHADVLVTDRPGRQAPEQPGGAGRVVAVALPGLATSFPGELPQGALDYAAEVAGHGDVFVPTERPDPDAAALRVEDGALSYGGLLTAARRAAQEQQLGRGVRLLTDAGPGASVAQWLAPLTLDGSLVLLGGPRPADELARLRTSERVDHVQLQEG